MFFVVSLEPGRPKPGVGSRTALRQVGIDSKSALKVGDIYEITYYPNRDGTAGGFMSKMVLPDGRVFDTKNTDPTAVPAPKTQ